MKARPGFTLIEVIVAVLIFGYMATSMATIYATSHRHMFQNYRSNVVKTNVLISMRAIQNSLSFATRIDFPGTNSSGDVLAFAVNVDQMSGCYPITRRHPVSWHYFCLANDAATPGYRSLYYHTGTLSSASGDCTKTVHSTWNASYPVSRCGSVGGTITKLLQYAPKPGTAPLFFSRRASDGVNDTGSVRVRVHSFWPAAASGFGRAQRDIDFELDSVMRVNRAQ